jgi:hypothetical protein
VNCPTLGCIALALLDARRWQAAAELLMMIAERSRFEGSENGFQGASGEPDRLS